MASEKKKVLLKEDKLDGFIYICPTCKTYICGGDKCHCCGQYLDWEKPNTPYTGNYKY